MSAHGGSVVRENMKMVYNNVDHFRNSRCEAYDGLSSFWPIVSTSSEASRSLLDPSPRSGNIVECLSGRTKEQKEDER